MRLDPYFSEVALAPYTLFVTTPGMKTGSFIPHPSSFSTASMRTFIAIELPTSILDYVAQVQQSAERYLQEKQVAHPLRWTGPANLHLTLRFLGDTTPSQQQGLMELVQPVARQHTPFVLALGELGCFPHFRSPNIVWMGLAGDLASLAPLQMALEQAAQAAGFAPETRPFTPHLTLARTQRHALRPQVAQMGRALQNFAATEYKKSALLRQDALLFSVTHLAYIQSELLPGGPRYTLLERFDLGNRLHEAGIGD
jgi:2'-5' RNA ligase